MLDRRGEDHPTVVGSDAAVVGHDLSPVPIHHGPLEASGADSSVALGVAWSLLCVPDAFRAGNQVGAQTLFHALASCLRGKSVVGQSLAHAPASIN